MVASYYDLRHAYISTLDELDLIKWLVWVPLQSELFYLLKSIQKCNIGGKSDVFIHILKAKYIKVNVFNLTFSLKLPGCFVQAVNITFSAVESCCQRTFLILKVIWFISKSSNLMQMQNNFIMKFYNITRLIYQIFFFTFSLKYIWPIFSFFFIMKIS